MLSICRFSVRKGYYWAVQGIFKFSTATFLRLWVFAIIQAFWKEAEPDILLTYHYTDSALSSGKQLAPSNYPRDKYLKTESIS